jgi:hypothetical protein
VSNRKSNTPSKAIVEHVKAAVAEDGLTAAQINRVIAAYKAAHAGAAVGTVAINDATGAVAKRINADGVHKWQILTDSGSSFDTRPQLDDGWDVVRRPVVETEAE